MVGTEVDSAVNRIGEIITSGNINKAARPVSSLWKTIENGRPVGVTFGTIRETEAGKRHQSYFT